MLMPLIAKGDLGMGCGLKQLCSENFVHRLWLPDVMLKRTSTVVAYCIMCSYSACVQSPASRMCTDTYGSPGALVMAVDTFRQGYCWGGRAVTFCGGRTCLASRTLG
jgi:hypothetical protein